MLKKLFFLSFFIFSGIFLGIYPKKKTIRHTFTPENTVFLWDIHDVVLQRDVGSMIKKGWKLRKGVLKNVNFSFVKKICKRIKRGETGDSFVQLAKDYNNPKLAHLIQELSLTQKPIDGTVHIIRSLKYLGYKQYVGSNIGQNIYNKMKSDACPGIKDVFALFNQDAPQVVQYNQKNKIKKPNPEFFKQFLQRNNIDAKKKHVIFIDDNKKNITAAKKLGLIGIHFKDPKQLRTTLFNLKII